MPSTCAMAKLPLELLEQIFTPILEQEWTGFMPSLIKAVRPEPYLYGVAMKIFLDMEHYFILSKKNNFQFKDMSKKAVMSIKKLRIMVEDHYKDENLMLWKTWEHNYWKVYNNPEVNFWCGPSGARTVHTVDIACNPIAALTNEELTRAISFWSSRISKLFETFIYFLLGLKGLRQVMLHVPILAYIPFADQILYHDGIQLANEVLGAKAKSLFQGWEVYNIRQRPPRYVPQESEWVWFAKDGGMLNEVLTKLIRKKQRRKEARKQLRAKVAGFVKRVRAKLRLDGWVAEGQ